MGKWCLISTVVLFLLTVTLAESQTQSIRVTVNHNRTIEKLVEAGKYDWSNPDITSKNFPSSQKGKDQVSIQLVYFDRYLTSDEILKTLAKQGLRPATLKELLTLGEQHPDLQRQFPIVALGSVGQNSDGDRFVAYLWGGGLKRHLRLRWLESRWRALCRFAAVRKSA